MHDLDPSIADTLHSLNPPDETEIVISGADLKGGLAAAEGHRKWQYQSAEKLRDIRRSLEHDMHEKSNEQLAEMIFVATGFDGVDDFILPEARELAQDCLTKVATNLESRGAQHLRDIICIILNSQLKPLFLPSPHPKVNLRTGRRLHVPNGGQPATADFYDDQTWKVEGRGCWNTLKWCISNLERGDYELLWPSLIPPLMTILDDHDLKFRITAIEILQELIRRVDRTLLKRTGIESLFAASLSISITYYNDPEAPVLLLEAVNCSRQLIELTAIPESQDRFERLSDLTTRAIIGGAWLYAGDKLPIMEASIEALIPLVSALHIGTCRPSSLSYPKTSFRSILYPQPTDFYISVPSVSSVSSKFANLAYRPGEGPFWRDYSEPGFIAGLTVPPTLVNFSNNPPLP
ncbi:hypothetical protein FRB96_001628 [Tulasnella sp. 330]|nr:hypothetical protein FRB96_001628 [Tulasnella sp. 330]